MLPSDSAPAAPTLFQTMQTWVDDQGQAGRRRSWLAFRPPSAGLLNNSASVTCLDPNVMGHLIVWETGECEIDLGSTTDPGSTLLRSTLLGSPEELLRVLEEAARFADHLSAEGGAGDS